jgi:hypothetical protein
MHNGRRTFLGLAVGGLGTLVGLFGTGRASAGHPRLFGYRRGCQPCYPSVENAPLCVVQRKQITAVPVIDFCFPASDTVRGNGGFFVWGYVDNSQVQPGTSLTATLNGTMQPYGVTPLNTVGCPAPVPYTTLPGSWTIFAFRFDNVQTGVQLTLTVTFTNTSGRQVSIPAPPFTCVY